MPDHVHDLAVPHNVSLIHQVPLCPRAATRHQVTPVSPGVVPEPRIVSTVVPPILESQGYLGSALGSIGLLPGGTAVELNILRVPSRVLKYRVDIYNW